MLRSLMLLNSCQTYDVRMWEKFEGLGLAPEELISGGETLWRQLGMSERSMAVLARNASSGWADRELELCSRSGVRIITCRDGIYPKMLRDLPDAPLLLYVRGEIFSPGSNAVAVVGTRRCSSYGIGVARDIGRRAASDGIVVVSGGAKGIDAAAHGGCLEGGGRTIAVFGNGIDVVYPAEHRDMFDRIAERGALCTEYPFGAKGEAWRFPRRNRIVVGLSSRIVVVEAPHKSGAMITARLAADAGREVWSVPGRINDDRCAGSNRLILDGAMPMIDLGAIFGEGAEQRLLFDDAVGTPAPRAEPKLSDSEKVLVALLSESGDRTIDNLADEAKMSAAEVFKMMSVLSLRGVVYASGPGRFRLADQR